MLPLNEINAMRGDDFITVFGDIAENSPWVAAKAAEARPCADRPALIEAFCEAVRSVPEAKQIELLNAHPDLAGRAAIAGEIGADSAIEQSAAGLDRLTPQEYERFSRFNEAYRSRFGFPFILAVRGATKHDVLDAFEVRLGNDREVELETALIQVCRIMRFRLEDRVEEV